MDRDKKVMSVEEFKETILKIKNYAEEICLHLMGEPTAHPEFNDILKVCSENNVLVNLTTNGLLIDSKKEFIIASPAIRQVNFSLQSYKDNFPHKPLDKYLSYICDFTKELYLKRPEVYVNYRMWNVGSEQDNNEFFDYIEKSFQIEINRKVQVENIKSKRIWNKLYLHFDSRFEWPSLDGEILSEKGRCHGLGNHIGIHADGSVVPCCLDKEAIINLGNIKDNDLESILNSELAVKMRDGFKKHILVHEMCKRCNYIQRFN